MTDFALYGLDLFGNAIVPAKRGALAERFEFPPFSVLNAREGDWQDRKRAWLDMGIQSEVGRDAENAGVNKAIEPGGGGGPNSAYMRSGSTRSVSEVEAASANKLTIEAGLTIGQFNNFEGATGLTGTSIFDPVLCELMYRWFCPSGGMILDPFAGGSVRGIVAGLLGYRYHGIDLRPEQIAANEDQRATIVPEADIVWRCGDSSTLCPSSPPADFIFSCPPYGDLERYSDNPADLSTMPYRAFIESMGLIVRQSARRLADNRFACFVVGDFRDRKSGVYRGFVGDTVRAFADAGMGLYNDAVLLTAVGSLPVRVGKQFEASRKLGKTHQNVLVFVKGDGKLAARNVASSVLQSIP